MNNVNLLRNNTGIKSLNCLCWTLHIVGQKVSTKSLMRAALSDCFSSSSCLLLREYWNLVPNDKNTRVKETKIWLPFKNHFLSQDALRTIKEIETLDTYICTPTIGNKRFPDVDKLCQVAWPSYLST